MKDKAVLTPRLLDLKSAAEYIGLAPQTLYNDLSRKGSKKLGLRFKRYGKKYLFERRDLDQFIDSLPYG